MWVINFSWFFYEYTHQTVTVAPLDWPILTFSYKHNVFLSSNSKFRCYPWPLVPLHYSPSPVMVGYWLWTKSSKSLEKPNCHHRLESIILFTYLIFWSTNKFPVRLVFLNSGILVKIVNSSVSFEIYRGRLLEWILIKTSLRSSCHIFCIFF